MATLVMDHDLEQQLRAERAATGADRYDEVWEGVYMMTPMPNDEHQQIVSRFVAIFEEVLGWPGLAEVRPGINVSDRRHQWQQNYRVPDVAVFLNDGQAENCGAYWLGGPDFVVEIVSPDDQTVGKLPFYAAVGVRELLLINRQPWSLRLYQLQDGQLLVADTVEPDSGQPIVSTVLPFRFHLFHGQTRPRIQVKHTASDKMWLV